MKGRKEWQYMDIASITSMISSVGFPIVACIFMAYMIKDITEKHENEMSSMRESLNANTTAIEKLETLINTVLLKLNDSNKD